MKKTILLWALLLLSSIVQPARADVTYLCEVTPDTRRTRPWLVEVRFLTGGEMRSLYNYHSVSDTDNYAVLLLPGSIEITRLNATVLFVTSSFGSSDFIRLFEVKGVVKAESLRSGASWTIRAKYPELTKDPWIDPRLNR